MSTSGKVLVVVAGIYFLAGIPGIIPAFGGPVLVQALAAVYLACILAALTGCTFAFTDRLSAARWLLLLPLGVASLAVGSSRLAAVFPSIVRVPITFTMHYPSGLVVFAGVNLVPLALLLILARVMPPTRPVAAEPVAPGPA